MGYHCKDNWTGVLMIPIIVLKIQYQVIYTQPNLSFQTYFEEYKCVVVWLHQARAAHTRHWGCSLPSRLLLALRNVVSLHSLPTWFCDHTKLQLLYNNTAFSPFLYLTKLSFIIILDKDYQRLLSLCQEKSPTLVQGISLSVHSM